MPESGAAEPPTVPLKARRTERVAGNLDSVTPVPPPISSVPTTRAVLKAGWVTGVTAGILCLLVRILAWVFRVPIQIQPVWGTGDPHPVTWLLFPVVPIAVGFLVSLGAAAFLGVRWARGWVLMLGTLVFVALLILPLRQPDDVLWSTRIWLAVMFLLTWVVVVPQVARVVGDSDPRVTATYRTSPAAETSAT